MHYMDNPSFQAFQKDPSVGGGRSNNIRFKDEQALATFKELMDTYAVTTHLLPLHNTACVTGATVSLDAINWVNDVTPLMAEGEVLLLAANDMQDDRHLVASARAISHDGRECSLDLDDIYRLAHQGLRCGYGAPPELQGNAPILGHIMLEEGEQYVTSNYVRFQELDSRTVLQMVKALAPHGLSLHADPNDLTRACVYGAGTGGGADDWAHEIAQHMEPDQLLVIRGIGNVSHADRLCRVNGWTLAITQDDRRLRMHLDDIAEHAAFQLQVPQISINPIDSRDHLLDDYVVIYEERENSYEDGEAQAFRCWAENTEHAKEQALDFQPDAIILEVGLRDEILPETSQAETSSSERPVA